MDGKVTLKLTEEQQRQIREATGRSETEMTIHATDSLSERDLDQVAGGQIVRSIDKASPIFFTMA